MLALLTVFACQPTGSRFDEERRPEGLAPFKVRMIDPARSEIATGALLLTQTGDDGTAWAAVIDGLGRHRWWFGYEEPEGLDRRILRARLSRDGQSVTVGVRNPDNQIPDAALLRVDRVTAAILEEHPILDHHHEHGELADGRLAYFTRRRVPDVWLDSGLLLASDAVLALDPDDGSTEVLFDALEDLDVEPYWTCQHMAPDQFVTGALDWTHGNSFVAHDDGSMTVGLRHLDAVVRVAPDRSITWWIGKPRRGFFGPGWPGILRDGLQAEGDARGPRHAHFTDAWEDGLIVFDNGNHTDQPTRVVEYAIDEGAGTFREVWSYEHPGGAQFRALGDVRRLPGGNVLVVWTTAGELWEVTRGGDIVWMAATEQSVPRVQFLEEW